MVVSPQEKREIIQLWKDVKNNPSAYSGLSKFHMYLTHYLKKQISRRDLDRIFREVPNYVMSIAQRVRIPRRHLFVNSSNRIFQADVAEMPKSGLFIGYLLVIDCFCDKIFTVLLKTRNSEDLKRAFLAVFRLNGGVRCEKMETDQAFKGLRTFFRSQNIYWHAKYGANKAFAAEKGVQTIHRRLYIAMRSSNTPWPKLLGPVTKGKLYQIWSKGTLDKKPSLISAYNFTPNAGIGNLIPGNLTPLDDEKIRKAKEKSGNFYTEPTLEEKKAHEKKWLRDHPDFKVGAYCFKPSSKAPFSKSYFVQRGQIYKVAEIRAGVSPVLVYLRDPKGNRDPRAYYSSELQIVKIPTKKEMYEIERIIGYKKVDGEEFVRVRWKTRDKKKVFEDVSFSFLRWISSKWPQNGLSCLLFLPNRPEFWATFP